MVSLATKPHRIKWIEAERELAALGIFLPSHSNGHANFPVKSDDGLPHQDKIHVPQKTADPQKEIA